MVFRCLLKRNSDKATIIAKKTATTAINVFKGTEIELLVGLVVFGIEVGAAVGFNDDVGLGELALRGMLAGMLIVCVLLQALVSPEKK